MPKIQVTEENGRSRIVAFGRKVENRPELFVTVKSSSESSSIAKVIVRDADPETYYSVVTVHFPHFRWSREVESGSV